MKKRLILLFLVIASLSPVKADEGMWLPFLLKNGVYEQMVAKGLKLTADQIYDINNSSIKDAIVRLGGGFCSGEMISAEGLFLTNHHCGFGAIQANSTPDHDYLKNGFWAMNRMDELASGFSVSFLERIEDVSDKALKGVTDQMTETERATKIRANSAVLSKAAVGDNKYLSAQVKSMFKGNAYYMFVYKTYKDVRLVGAPPSSVGKYGGDTDNWMWPRHTGDFSMFRVYAGTDNEPAEISDKNVPYKPKHHLPISMKGVDKGDYSMILGYPGSTDRYLTSHGVKFAVDTDQPSRVKVRRKKLDIYEAHMATSDKIRIQYASKRARVSNYWKYFIGQTRGLKKLNVYDKKLADENKFNEWANSTDALKAEYGNTMELYQRAFDNQNKYSLNVTYLNEAVFGAEILAYAYQFVSLKNMLKNKKKAGAKLDATIARINGGVESHFKDYHKPIDVEVFAAMMKFYSEDIPEAQQGQEFVKLVKKFKGDFDKMAAWVFKKSIMDDEAKVKAFMKKPKYRKLKRDKAVKIIEMLIVNYRQNIRPQMGNSSDDLTKAKRQYVRGLMVMNKSRAYAPDANSTMRVSFGNVLGYTSDDGVKYHYTTTIDGAIEKYVAGDDEFDLPAKFLELYKKKDYGQYADKNGNLIVCFTSNNDITGGNSGSPVINGDGELIGTAFDGNWEAMSGDIAFEPDLQRTISVDIRYTLWCIDKLAGAGHIIKEMTLKY
jgi:hypothetical protein